MSVVFKINKYNADAELCYRELQSIGENFTPKQVVDFARDENTELHKCFTWDDTLAAEKWRKQEARLLIANIVYTKDKETKEPSLVRAISYIEENKSFKSTNMIVRNKSEYESLLERALAELHSFKMKYSALSELSEIMALID